MEVSAGKDTARDKDKEREKDNRDKLLSYLVKDDAFGRELAAILSPALAQAVGEFSEVLVSQNIAERHKNISMMRRIGRKIQEREKEKQRLRDEVRGAMGDEYEEENEEEKDDEESFLDEEEKEFMDRGRFHS